MASRQSGDDLEDEEQGGARLLPGLPLEEGGEGSGGQDEGRPTRAPIPSRLFSQSSHSYPLGGSSYRARSCSPVLGQRRSPSPSLPTVPDVPEEDLPSPPVLPRPGMARSDSAVPAAVASGLNTAMAREAPMPPTDPHPSASHPPLLSPQPMRKSPSMSSFLSPPPPPTPGLPVPPPIVTGKPPIETVIYVCLLI